MLVTVGELAVGLLPLDVQRTLPSALLAPDEWILLLLVHDRQTRSPGTRKRQSQRLLTPVRRLKT